MLLSTAPSCLDVLVGFIPFLIRSSLTSAHAFFKSEIANISGLPYEEIQKEQLKDYLDMTVLRVDQEWNITIG